MSEPFDTAQAVSDYLKSGAPDPGDVTRASMASAIGSQPDYEAELRQIAAKTGVPVDTARNQPQLKDQAKLAGYDFGALAKDFPQTSAFLSHVPNAQIAHDDTDNLTGLESALNYLKKGGQAFLSGAPQFNAGIWGALRVAPDLLSKYIGQPLAGTILPEDPFARMSAQFADYQQQQQALADRAMPKAGNLVEASVYSGLQSTGQTLLSLPTALLTGQPELALAPMAAATGGQSYGKAREKGLSPEQSALYALSDAVVEYGTEKLPLVTLLKNLKVGTPFFKTFVTDQLQEQLGEQAATALQDLNEWATLNPDKPFSSYLEERPAAALQTAIATAVGSGAQVTVMKGADLALSRLAGKQAQVQQAQAGAEVLGKLHDLAAASKVRARDTETFENFIAQASEDGPVQDVFIDGKSLAQSGVDVAKLAQSSTAVAEQLEAAIASGGDIRIPVQEFAAKLAGTDLAAQLIPHLRTDPAGMSQVQAQDYMQHESEHLKQEVDQVLAEQQDQSAFDTSKQAVQAEFKNQLESAGRFTSDVNDAYAGMLANFYAVTAAKIGQSPQQLLNRYPLRVQAEGLIGPRTLASTQASTQEQTATPLEAQEQKSNRNGVYYENVDPDSGTTTVNPSRSGVYKKLSLGDKVRHSVLNAEGDFVPAESISRREDNADQETRAWTPPSKEHADIVARLVALAADMKISNEQSKDLTDLYRKVVSGEITPQEAREAANKILGPQTLAQAELSVQAAGTTDFGEGKRLATEQFREFGDYQYDGTTLTKDGEKVADLKLRIDGNRLVIDNIVVQRKGQGTGTAAINAIIDSAQAQGLIPVLTTEAGMGKAHQKRLREFYQRLGFVPNKGKTKIKGIDEEFYHPGQPPEQTLAQGGELNEANKAVPTGKERASLTFGEDITAQPSVITLFANADLSSFLHEAGHFYLEVYSDLVNRPEVTPEIKADLDTVFEWFGDGIAADKWAGMDLEQKRSYHEQFARGFEAYLFEGKAPSLELRAVFQRFRAWMVNVYRSLVALRVDLNDDVRQVFDRMLASTDAIREAEAVGHMQPVFQTAEQAQMSAEAFRAYHELGLQASQDAISTLETRSLKDLQWLNNARGKILKQLQRDASDKRKAVRAEVEAEVNAEPVNLARRFLKYGELNHDNEQIQIEKGAKLSIAALKELYPEGALGETDWRSLGYGKYGMLAEEGLAPDLLAPIFGYSSGDALVHALLSEPAARAKIDEITDQRMLERYGDLTSPQVLEQAVAEAMHNKVRTRFLATEANALAKAAGQRKVLTEAARQYAEDLIARLKVRDVKPGQYRNAEARAAREAEDARRNGDIPAAATAKRNQLIQHYAAHAALNAQDEIAKAVRYLKGFERAGTRKGLSQDYLEQIDALLERFDLRSGISLREIQRRQSLVEWVQAQKDKGLEPVIPDGLLNEANRTHYKELTVEELRGLADAVKNIAHLGRLKQKLLTIRDQRAFNATVEEAVDSIRTHANRSVSVAIERNTAAEKLAAGAGEFFAIHRKFSSLTREMDGFEDGGVMWETFTRGMNAAGDQEAVLREQAVIDWVKLFAPLQKEGGLRKKLYIPEIKGSLSLQGRLAVALNTGNDGNLQRLMDGDGWNLEQVNAILKTLTPEQLKFVQGVWDLIGGYKEQIGAQQKRLTGVEPAWVEPRPFTVTLADGTTVDMQGGYYPAKYDTERSTRAMSDEASANIMEMWQGRNRPQTRSGFTKERAAAVVNRPLRKDLNVITQHLTEVTHRLAWQDYLTDATRLLNAGPIDQAIRDHYGPQVLQVMRKTMEDIAAGEVGAQNVFERAVNYLRSGATVAGLGWNLLTSLLQPIGLTQSIVRIGPQWVAKGMSRWLRDTASFESSVKWINQRSDFMRLRAKTQQREISEIRNQIASKGQILSTLEESYFTLIAKMQLVADVPTWLGMYEKAMAQGHDEDKAVALADQAVLDSQGGGQIKDLAQIQRGGPLMKLWTNFYSFFNVSYNQLAEATRETQLKGSKHLPLLAVDFLMLTTVPAVLGYVLKAALRGDPDQDPEELAKALAKENLSYLFGMMVGLREVGSILASPGGYNGMAGTRFLTELGKLYQQAVQGEPDEAFWKSVNNVGGILLHYPAGAVQRLVTGMQALADGQTDNPLAPVVGVPRK